MTSYAVLCCDCGSEWLPARSPRPVAAPRCSRCRPFVPVRPKPRRLTEDDQLEPEPVLVRGIDREDVTWRRVGEAARDQMLDRPDPGGGLVGWSRRSTPAPPLRPNPAPAPRDRDTERERARAALPSWLPPAAAEDELVAALRALRWPPNVDRNAAVEALSARLDVPHGTARRIIRRVTETTTSAAPAA